MDSLQEALDNPDQRFDDSPFEGFLRAFTADVANAEDAVGDLAEFGRYAVLVAFSADERARIEAALETPNEPWEAQGLLTVVFTDDGCMAWYDGHDVFDKVNEEYHAFLDDAEETVTPLCALAMGCLCAAHARGRSADGPCDANEEVTP